MGRHHRGRSCNAGDRTWRRTVACRRAAGGLRLRPAAGGHRPDAGRAARRGPPAGRPAGRPGRRRTATSATCPSCCGPATSSSSTTRGSSRPGCTCAGRRAAPSRCCCSSRSTASTARGRRWCGRAAELPRRRAAARPDGAAVAGASAAATEAGDTLTRRARAPTTRWRARRGTARCRCRPTSPRRWPTPSATRPSTPQRPGSVAAPTAGLHLTPDGARPRWPSGGVGVATVELVVGLDTFKPVTVDDPDRPPHAQRALPRARPRRWPRAATRAERRGGRRHHDGAGPRERGGHRRAERPHRAVHPPAVPVAGRRRAADQLPPAPHDAADADRRLRRAPLARPLRRRPGRAATASCPSATPCCSTRRPRDGAGHARRRRPPTARPGPAWPAPPAGTYRTPCFMPVGTRGAVKYLVGRRLRAARRRDRAGQHLPPDAAARRRGGRRARRPAPLHRLGRAHAHRLGRLPGLLARARTSTTTASPSAPPTTARATASRPESAVAMQEQLGADIQMVLDVCPPLPSPPEVVRLAVERTAAWAKRARGRARTATDQALFGIVQGGVDEALRARERRSARSSSTSTATASAGCRWARPATRCCRRWPPPSPSCRADRPRYLMGVGDPASLVEAVALGVDLFDCVLPTRLGRHGTALTGGGQGPACATPATPAATSPLDPTCACPVCRRHSPRLPAPPLPGRRADGVPPAHAAQPGLDVRPAWTGCGRHRRRHASHRSAREVLATWA